MQRAISARDPARLTGRTWADQVEICAGDVFGRRLYAVNAKFGTPPAGTPYQIVQVRR